MSATQRLRITVGGAAEGVVEPTPDRISAVAPARPDEFVVDLRARHGDRRRVGRRFEIVVGGWRFEVAVESAALASLRERARRAAHTEQTMAALTLRAQIPGRVARLWVSEGERVEQGQPLLAVEAMKMENEIRAPRAGVVQLLRVELRAKVERGDELLTLG